MEQNDNENKVKTMKCVNQNCGFQWQGNPDYQSNKKCQVCGASIKVI
jgi:hypothetical protein